MTRNSDDSERSGEDMGGKRLILTVLSLLVWLIPASADKNDRGITSLTDGRTPYALKGSWTIGGTAYGSSYSINNYQMAVVNGVGGDGYGISAKIGAAYAVLDDFSVGVRMLYDRNRMSIASASVAVSDISLNVNDFYSIQQNIGGEFFCRKYLPLGHSGRFSVFIEAAFQVTGGQGKIQRKQDAGTLGTYETTTKIALNANPGLAMYVTPHFVMDCGVGLVGLGYSWTNQVHNQVASGTRNGFSASYILNILAISLGVHYSF